MIIFEIFSRILDSSLLFSDIFCFIFLMLVMISFITILVIIYNYIDMNITNLVGTIGLFGVSAFRLAPIVSQLVVTNNSIRFNRDCLKRLTNDLEIIEFNMVSFIQASYLIIWIYQFLNFLFCGLN